MFLIFALSFLALASTTNGLTEKPMTAFKSTKSDKGSKVGRVIFFFLINTKLALRYSYLLTGPIYAAPHVYLSLCVLHASPTLCTKLERIHSNHKFSYVCKEMTNDSFLTLTSTLHGKEVKWF